MKIAAILVAAVVLSGCSSFKLGGMAYCPYGQHCQFKMEVPAK